MAMASADENGAGNHNKNTDSPKASTEFQLKKYLLLLATLVATVTYVAGLNLPGGSWTEDTPGGQVAGESILRETYYYRYIVFYYCNAVSFAASLVVSLLLLVLHKGGSYHYWLRPVMVIDLFGLMGAYAAGSSRDKFTTVCAAVMVAGLAAYVTVAFIWYVLRHATGGTAANKKEESPDQEAAALAEHEILMVLAIFVATVAYVAAMNPPGGFWRSTQEGHHTGGDPILQGGHSGRYKSFFFFNTTAFVASLLAIMLILDYKKLNISSDRFGVGRCGLYVSLIIAIGGLGGAYAAGSCRNLESTAIVLSLGPVVLIYIALQVGVSTDKLPCIGRMCSYPRKWLPVITRFVTDSTCTSRPPPPLTDEKEKDKIPKREHDENEKLNKAREFIQLLAILAATITYQAGLDPPGGLWLESGEGHTVGDSILLTTHPIRYKAFFYSNSVAFVASLVIIVMLQSEMLVRLHILEATMILDLFSLMGAYAAGSSRDTSTSIYIVAMAGAVLIYVVIHIVFFTLDPEDMDTDVLDKCREVLLLLAILAASITYQAGLTPPGGFWEMDDEKHGHHAGFSILQDKYHLRYKAFFYCNAASFMASVALIILLVNPTLYKPAIECYALFVCMVGGMFGLMGAYAAGSSLHLRASIIILVLVALVFGFVVYLVLTGSHKLKRKEPAGQGEPQGGHVTDDAAKDQNQPGQGVQGHHVADNAAKDQIQPAQGVQGDHVADHAAMHQKQPAEGNHVADNNKAIYLMLLGILSASVTYLTGLKPPGGLWRDDNNGHSAGSPVLYDMHRRRYMVYFYSNSISFMASIIVVIALLLLLRLLGKKSDHWSLHTVMVLDMLALLVAYAAGSARKWGTFWKDRRFILKAQPWHHKRDGVIFAEFDGKGNPTEVDLGVMPIWVQVRDLDFELKTESMGWTLGEQLGDCCGIVGHTSECYCSIPKDKRVASFPKNLSVEAYWKGTWASKRTHLFAGSNSNNYYRAAEKSVVKVTKAVADLTVTDMLTTTSTTPAAAAFRGRVSRSAKRVGCMGLQRRPTQALAPVRRTSQHFRDPLLSLARRARERRGGSFFGAKHGQEGHVLERRMGTTISRALVHADGRMFDAAIQGSQGLILPVAVSNSDDAAGANNLQDMLLFKPGILEALSGAVAARLADQNTTNDTGVFTFAAGKISMQGQKKKRERIERREEMRSQRVIEIKS
ncbi:unnamed protein product [Triticum turgidum subsp. durum]|uniref:PGG domain-containing protein n=1 Tax=Triticum turgidum subsp. durum TaxID=4567 RepID=A0A9R0Y8Z7_TRITD|nr:unnamed protein product [Triticum turgidum subsp. durum]